MNRASKLLAAAVVVVAVGGVTAVAADAPSTGVKICMKTSAEVRAPKADGSCARSFTPVELSTQSDVNLLAERIAELTARVEAVEPQLELTGREVGTGYELTVTYARLFPTFVKVSGYDAAGNAGFITGQSVEGQGAFTTIVACDAPYTFVAFSEGLGLSSGDLDCRG